MNIQKAILYGSAISLAISIVGLGYFCEQSQFSRIISFFLLGFVAYLVCFLKSKPTDIPWLVGWAILLRFILVFAFPALSDDIYRFIWDGHLWLCGHNPFEQLPTYYMTSPNEVARLTPELFDVLNSQQYFTIYPPIAQATFTIGVGLSPNSWWGAAVVMKLLLFGCEIGAILLLWRLLTHFKLPPANVLLYALNPLVMVEVVGNLHHEGMMVFFLLLAFYYLSISKYHWSAIAMACSIASKLLPLMFLPFLIRRLGWKRSFSYFAILGLTCIVLFLPLLSEVFFQNFSKSLDLYFRRFEFNGSIYYVLRNIGYAWTGHNMIQKIGPVLGLLTLSGILIATFVEKQASWKNLPLKWLFAISLYLCFTPTIHPWYTILPILLCSFTRLRYPIIWSGLIFFTYINYSYNPYHENLGIVYLEYSILLMVLGVELFLGKAILQSPYSAGTGEPISGPSVQQSP